MKIIDNLNKGYIYNHDLCLSHLILTQRNVFSLTARIFCIASCEWQEDFSKNIRVQMYASVKL